MAAYQAIFRNILTLSSVAVIATGCATAVTGPSATAQLQATKGNAVSGVVTFTQADAKVYVRGEVKGLKPNAVHGFHVHDKGDCSSGDGMSTGGHFNPTGKPHGEHGSHGSDAHHTGDLPPLVADSNGMAKFEFVSTSLAVGTGIANVVGRGLIVHKDPDDFKTQPTGNSGARVACAVIVLDTK